jgi:hypothetical protein
VKPAADQRRRQLGERLRDHFTRPEAIVTWMGDYARLDPRPDGAFHVVPVLAAWRSPPPPATLGSTRSALQQHL